MLTNKENPQRVVNIIIFEKSGRYIKSNLINEVSNIIIATDKKINMNIFFEYDILDNSFKLVLMFITKKDITFYEILSILLLYHIIPHWLRQDHLVYLILWYH
jgi:hypothetical protein